MLLQSHAIFHGLISSDIEGSEDNSQKRMQRSGFAGINTEVMAWIHLLQAASVCICGVCCICLLYMLYLVSKLAQRPQWVCVYGGSHAMIR